MPNDNRNKGRFYGLRLVFHGKQLTRRGTKIIPLSYFLRMDIYWIIVTLGLAKPCGNGKYAPRP